MAKNDVEKVTEEKIAKGGILVRFYFDMQHTEKDKLQPLMANLINENLLKEKGIVYCYGSIEEPLEKEGIFTTSGIVTVLFESLTPVMGVMFKYAPAGVEVLKPENEYRIKMHDLQGILMDISQISMDYSKYILEHTMKGEELENLKKKLENRAEIGKKFLENREGKDEKEKK